MKFSSEAIDSVRLGQGRGEGREWCCHPGWHLLRKGKVDDKIKLFEMSCLNFLRLTNFKLPCVKKRWTIVYILLQVAAGRYILLNTVLWFLRLTVTTDAHVSTLTFFFYLHSLEKSCMFSKWMATRMWVSPLVIVQAAHARSSLPLLLHRIKLAFVLNF